MPQNGSVMWYEAWLVLLTTSELTSNIENAIFDTLKHFRKATLEKKKRQMVEAEVLRKCSIFIDILDFSKIFSEPRNTRTLA